MDRKQPAPLTSLQFSGNPDTRVANAASLKSVAVLSALDDAALGGLASRAAAMAAEYCRLPSVDGAEPTFARNTYTETFYERWPRQLRLGHYPATLASVTIDGEAVPVVDCVAIGGRGLLRLPAYAARSGTLVVTYAAGWVTPVQADDETPPTGPALPSAITDALRLTAQGVHVTAQREQLDVQSFSETEEDLGTSTTRYFSPTEVGGGSVPMAARMLLDPYVRLS